MHLEGLILQMYILTERINSMDLDIQVLKICICIWIVCNGAWIISLVFQLINYFNNYNNPHCVWRPSFIQTLFNTWDIQGFTMVFINVMIILCWIVIGLIYGGILLSHVLKF
jgi:flagellar biosynthesis protein FlhB